MQPKYDKSKWWGGYKILRVHFPKQLDEYKGRVIFPYRLKRGMLKITNKQNHVDLNVDTVLQLSSIQVSEKSTIPY